MVKHFLFPWILTAGLVLAGTTGKLTGHVTDAESGEPLPGCNIIVVGTNFGAATDMNGEYFILNLPPGAYDIKAMMIGYTPKTVTGVQINIDLTTRVDFSLPIQILEGDEVTVTAERPNIQMDLTSSETRVSSDQLDAMPVNEIWDVINAQAGVTKDAGGGIHIRGGRAREVAYWVDGVSVTDAYDGGLSVAVDNDAIQELQVISGTFNAEYGQAMSGIINLVTKDGGQKFDGYVSAYNAQYTTNDDLLKGKDEFSFADDQNLEASLSGPVPLLKNRLTFYAYGRVNRQKGWLYGWKIFDRWGRLQLPLNAYGQLEEFNPEVVPMNTREKSNFNTKLTLRLTNTMKLRYNLITSNETYQDYNHNSQYSPEGELHRFNEGVNQKLSFTHSPSSRTFYTIDISRFAKKYHHYAFKDPNDPRYVDPYYFFHQSLVLDINTFKIWGVDMSRFSRSTTTGVAKIDITSQLNSTHQIKLGFEYREHDLILNSYSLEDGNLSDTVFTVRAPGSFSIDQIGDAWTVLDTVTGKYFGWEWNQFASADTVYTFSSRNDARSFVDYYNKYIQFGRGFYYEKPQEMSAYIQDKIEFKNVIINLGLRWDWFDANGVTPTNPAEPYMGNPRNATLDSLTIRERKNIHWADYADYYAGVLPDSGADLRTRTGWWKQTSVKQQLSPRFGVAYPITDKGVIHFSFGHFFQIPSFENLYKDPGIKLAEESGKFGVFGNPDLSPQKTVMYEIGLQQELGLGLTMDITGYYRDVRDWVSTGIPIDMGGGASYFTYINKDYSNVRGITLNLEKRFSRFYGFSLNYTFQVAEGSNSNPDEEFGAIQNNSEPVRAILPLDWDQTHTLNGALFLGGRSWSLSFLGQFGSGYPYTPTQNVATTQGINVSTDLPRNSRRKPITYNLDLNFQYQLPLQVVESTVFVKIFNVLDRRNELTVWSDTGTAKETYNIQGTDSENRPNTITEYYTHPEWFSAPRQVQIGIKINF
ncbi:MAG: carboxypeptidase-like regulatory domain-containing protein [Fidelibacterota bacterium]